MRLEATGPLSNNEQVRRARFAATPTASPQGPAPITARSSINEPLSRHFDNLIAMRTHAHVLDGCMGKVLEPVEVGPGPCPCTHPIRERGYASRSDYRSDVTVAR